VRLQEDHHVRDLPLVDPRPGDAAAADGTDAVDLAQLRRPIDDVQGGEAEVSDEPPGHDQAHTADEPRAQVLLDADHGGRLDGHVGVGPELLAVPAIHRPAAARAEALARLHAEQVADDRGEIPLAQDLQLHHAPGGLLVRVGDALEDAFEGRGRPRGRRRRARGWLRPAPPPVHCLVVPHHVSSPWTDGGPSGRKRRADAEGANDQGLAGAGRCVAEHEKTPAMRDTPRKRLFTRALRGHWARFPVSPAHYDPVFRRVVEARDHYGERATFALARRLEAGLAKAGRRAVGPAERLALHRAFLTGMIAALERADDSCGVLGDLFHECLPDYFAVPWAETGIAADLYYRNFLEYATWEDYGLLAGRLGPLFAHVATEHVAMVDAVLRGIREELLAAALDDQAEKALALRGALHVAKRSFGRFVALATEMGSREWERVTTMAEAALRARRRDLALAVFAAADQPGFHRDYLREQCRRLTGTLPTARRPRAHPTVVRRDAGGARDEGSRGDAR